MKRIFCFLFGHAWRPLGEYESIRLPRSWAWLHVSLIECRHCEQRRWKDRSSGSFIPQEAIDEMIEKHLN